MTDQNAQGRAGQILHLPQVDDDLPASLVGRLIQSLAEIGQDIELHVAKGKQVARVKSVRLEVMRGRVLAM